MRRTRTPGLIDSNAQDYQNKYSLYFDGSGDRVSTGDWHLDQPFSFAVWAKADVEPLSTSRSPISKYSTTDNQRCWMLYASTHDPSLFYFYTSSDGVWNSEYGYSYYADTVHYSKYSWDVPGDEWSLWSMSFHASGITIGSTHHAIDLFRNGRLEMRQSWNAAWGAHVVLNPNSAAEVCIGGSSNGNYAWLGHIAEAAIWSGIALEPEDHSRIWAARGQANHLQSFGDYDKQDYLEAWWKMGDGPEAATGTTIYDCSGKNHHGTMVGPDATDYTLDHP